MVRSAWREKRVSCVTMQIVAPARCRSRSSSITASPFFESRFPVGSSASRIERLADERARHGDALLLAARELARQVLRAVRHAHALERLERALLALGRRACRGR